MAREPRQNDRVNAEVPVRLEDGTGGVTRNISPGGVYFVVDEKLSAGQSIRFSIEFTHPAGPADAGVLHLDCVGSVVRVEEAHGKRGVAVKIVESRLERREMPLVAAGRADR